jgi:hypothetical protein
VSQARPSPRQVILLIGSDPSLLASRQRVIESGGCDVIVAYSEEQAHAVLQHHVFDLLVVSHTVPGGEFERLEQLVAHHHPETLLLRLPPEMPSSDERYIRDAMPEALLGAVTAILSSRHQPSIELNDALLDRRRNREQWLTFVDHLLAEGFVLHTVEGAQRVTSPDGSHSVTLPSYEGSERGFPASAPMPEIRRSA